MDELPENLQDKLKAYQAKWKQMDDLKAMGEGDIDLVAAATMAKEALGSVVTDAVIVAHDLMLNSDSDTERGRMARYIIDSVIKEDGMANPADPLADLLRDLTKPKEEEVTS